MTCECGQISCVVCKCKKSLCIFCADLHDCSTKADVVITNTAEGIQCVEYHLQKCKKRYTTGNIVKSLRRDLLVSNLIIKYNDIMLRLVDSMKYDLNDLVAYMYNKEPDPTVVVFATTSVDQLTKTRTTEATSILLNRDKLDLFNRCSDINIPDVTHYDSFFAIVIMTARLEIFVTYLPIVGADTIEDLNSSSELTGKKIYGTYII